MGASAKELLQKLEDQIDADCAAKINCAYELRFVGEEQRWYLDFRRSENFLSTESSDGEFCSLGLKLQDLEDLIEARVTLAVLFSTGQLRVFGDIGEAMKLEILFSRS